MTRRVKAALAAVAGLLRKARGWGGLPDWVRGAVTVAGSAVGAGTRWVGGWLGNAMAAAGSAVTAAASRMKATLADATTAVGAGGRRAGGWLRRTAACATAATETAGRRVGGWLADAANAAGLAIMVAARRVGGWLANAVAVAADAIGTAGRRVGAWLANATVASAIGAAVRRIGTRLGHAIAAAGSAIRAGGQRAKVWLGNAMAGAGSAIMVAARRVGGWLANAAAALGSALRAVLRWGAALDWAKTAWVAAASAILFGCVSLLLWVTAPVETRADAPADGETVVFTVAPGATFGQVTDTLVARGLVRRPLLFRFYGRLRRDDRNVRSGTYALDAGAGWGNLLDALVAGRVTMVPVTIPEGFTLPQIAARLAGITELATDAIRLRLGVDSAHARWNLPGPGLEGYLFPDTYHFARGVPLETVVEEMSERYREYWTPERRARAAELGLSEREVVTLASIIQAEVRVPAEVSTISAVYHNRLRIGMRLQADPTVLYALGGHRPRLLYAAIDSVAANPYNTYTQRGLPPGPIGAPGTAALDAALHPAEADYLYFVANADGSHTFSRTLTEHNRARARARRATSAATRGGG